MQRRQHYRALLRAGAQTTMENFADRRSVNAHHSWRVKKLTPRISRTTSGEAHAWRPNTRVTASARVHVGYSAIYASTDLTLATSLAHSTFFSSIISGANSRDGSTRMTVIGLGLGKDDRRIVVIAPPTECPMTTSYSVSAKNGCKSSAKVDKRKSVPVLKP